MNKSRLLSPALVATAAASIALTTSAKAASILLNDPGFETAPGGGFTGATAWPGSNTATHASFSKPNNGALGTRFGFENTGDGSPSTQTLTNTYTVNTTYTFKGYSVDIGLDGIATSSSDLRFSLGYMSGATFIELDGMTYDMDLVATTGWTLLDGITLTTGSSGAEIGQQIVVRLTSVGGATGAWFDNVTLEDSTVVPEPSAALLGSLGVLALLRRRR